MDILTPVGQIVESVNTGTLDDITEFFESLAMKDNEEEATEDYQELNFND